MCGDASCQVKFVAVSQNDFIFEPVLEHAPLDLLFAKVTLIFDVQANKILDAKPSVVNALETDENEVISTGMMPPLKSLIST